MLKTFVVPKLFFKLLVLAFILSACGEVVGTKDYSTIVTSEIGWKNVVNINASNISTFPLSGTCTTQAGSVTVNIGTPMMATQTLSCVKGRFLGSMDLSSVGIPEGMTELYATQSVLTAEASTNLLVDTIMPIAPVIISPSAGSTVSTRTLTVDGTCESGTTVLVTGDVGSAPVSVQCLGGNFSVVVVITIGDGPKVIDVAQRDLAGNLSPTDTVNIILDTTPGTIPLAPVITSPITGSITNSTNQTLIGTCETGATLNITGAVLLAPVVSVCVGGVYNQPITLTPANGIKVININQTNLAGTSPTTSINIILDTILPTAPLITSPTNASSVNTVTQTVVGTCETGATVSITGNIIGGPIVSVCVGGTYSEVINLTPGDGPKTINAVQVDPAGNTSPASTITITLDTVAPLAPVITSPTSGSLVNTVSQTVIGTCETGATVSISGNIVGSPINTTCIAGNYSQPVTLTAVDGLKTISVVQTDPAGNTSPTSNITVTLDSTAPIAPTITSPTNSTTVTTVSQTVVGTCETGATVNISGNIVGSPVSTACVAGNYSQPVNLTAGDGVKNISATQTDVAGNISVATNISITLDATAPIAPTITSPSNSSLVNTVTQTVVGACETGATVNISGNIVGSPVTATCVANSYTRSVTLTAGDGLKNISATQTDGGGNTSVATNISVTLDTVAPIAPTITSPVNGSTVNSVSQTVTGVCETGATVNISGNIVGSPVTAACIASSYTRSISLTAGDGVKNISATQTDVAGNISVATNISITLDGTAPAAPTITSPTNGSSVNTISQTIVGTCENGSTVNISGNVVGAPVSVICAASSYSQAVTLVSGDGSKTISVNQTDIASNTSPSTNISITLDTTAPSAPTITSPTNSSSTNSVSQTVIGACETGATVNISGNIVGSSVTATCVASSYSRAVTLTAGDGLKNISATQTDVAGNTSAATNIAVTLDTLAPSAPTITSPANGTTFGSASQTVVGACETGATVNISGNIVGSPVTATCVASSYSRAVTLTAGDGLKTISATQTDVAGNTSAATNISITLDTTAPLAPTITSPANGSFVNNVSQTVIGTCETGATVNISGNIIGSPVTATCVASSYSRSITLTAGDGAKNISATQTDVVGNISVATNIIINLDTVPLPAPVITSPANGSYSNTIAITITGTCTSGRPVDLVGDFTPSPVSVGCVASAFTRNVNLTAANGLKNISATQTDLAGNISAPAAITITLDTVVPSAPTITSPANGSLVNSVSQTIIGACETGTTVNVSGNIVGSPVTATCVASSYSRTVTLTAGDGLKTISATQTDLAGNISVATNISITLDTTAPAAPTITSPTTGIYSSSTTQTIVGACETGATLNLTGNIVGSPQVSICVGGTYSEVVTLTAGDSAKTISATQTDPAGNTSTSTSIIINLDTAAPSAPTITSPTNGSSTNSTAQTVIGACETGTTVNVSGNIVGSPVTAACVASSYSRAVTLTAGDGLKTISATQTDLAGNISTATNISITLDTSAPTVVVSTVASSPTPTSPIPFVITFNQAVTGFIITDVTVTNGSVTSFSGGPSVYNIDVTPTGAGVVSVSVAASVAQDLAGNNNTISNTLNITYTPLVSGDFISTWTIPIANTAVELPLKAGYLYNFTIDWGDGSPIQTVTSDVDADKFHTYVSAGSYTVTMTGLIEAYGLISGPNCYISDVIQMGYTGWKDLSWAFKYCGDLVNVAVVNGLEFSDVTSMAGMFYFAGNANPNTSLWDVSKVTDFERMFQLTSANPNVTNWDVSSATNMQLMFGNTSAANPDVSLWNVSNVTNFSRMFARADVANPVTTSWNVSAATNMSSMFLDAVAANPNTTSWNVANVTNMSGMFDGAAVANPNVTSWNVSGVTNMQQMFKGATSANPNVTNWNVSNVTNMSGMFNLAVSANPVTTNWNVSNVVQMLEMFDSATSADPNTTNWNVSSVTNMQQMFNNATSANPNVTNWNVSNVTNLSFMFSNAPLANPNVTNWNVSNVTNMNGMFDGADVANPVTINWVLSSLVTPATTLNNMFRGTNLSDINYSDFLVMANTTSTLNGVDLGTVPAKYYPYASASRANLVGPRTWIIIDEGPILPPNPVVISTPSNNSYTNLVAQTITGTCEIGATVNILGNIVGSPVTTTCPAGNYSRAITLVSGDGPKTVTVNQTNTYGLTSTDVSITINLDTAAPLTPSITLPSNGSSTNTTAQTVIGTCETNATVNVSGNIVGSPVTATCVAGNYSRAVTLVSGDGLKTISATQTDLAGNTSGSTSVSITLDTSAPTAPTITSPANNSYTNTTARTIVGACETNAVVSISGNIIGSPVNTICVASAYSQAVTLTSGDGAKSVSVLQTDAAGNASSSTAITINLDTVAPSAPTITTPTNNSFTKFPAQTVTGTCEPGATVNLSGNFTPSPTTAICTGGGTYSRAVTLTNPDAVKTINVTQTDLASNTSGSVSITLTLDRVAPAAPTITSPLNFAISNSSAQTITGSCETSANVSLTGNIIGAPVSFICVGSTYSQAVTLTAGEEYKVVDAQQTDRANNASTFSTINIYYDNNSPTVVVSSTTPASTSVSPIPFRFTFNESVTGFISGDVTVVNGSVSSFSGGPAVYNIQVTPTAVGNVSVSLAAGVAQDAAANGNIASNTLVRNFIYPTNAFVSRWVIPANNTTYTLPLKSGLTYNFTVNWGDGSPLGTITSDTDPDRIHTWTTAGTYTVTMTGVIQGYGDISAVNCYISEVLNLGVTDWRDMSHMFKNCTSLVNVATVDGQETINVTNMGGMFYGSTNANPNVRNWNVSNVNGFAYMFAFTNFANPDTSLWNTTSMDVVEGMFSDTIVANPDVSGWDVDQVINFRWMFYNASAATPNVSSWQINTNLAQSVEMTGMFQGALISNPDVALWNTSRVINTNYMFAGINDANKFTGNPNVTNWNTSRITNMESMFKHTLNAAPNTTSWNVSNVTNMTNLFSDADAANPNVTNWNVSNVTEMAGMFSDSSILNPNVALWDVSSVTTMESMFTLALNANPNVTSWDVSSVTRMERMFYNAPSADPDTSGWTFAFRTDNLNTSISSLFAGSAISNINYGKFLIMADSTAPAAMDGVTLGYVPAQFPATSAAARTSLLGKSWIFTDDGAE